MFDLVLYEPSFFHLAEHFLYTETIFALYHTPGPQTGLVTFRLGLKDSGLLQCPEIVFL